MSSDHAVIVAEHLGKLYRLGALQQEGRGFYSYKTLRDAVGETLAAPARLLRSLAGRRDREDARAPADLWALEDVSFEVKAGEVLGVIGRNGAGKSTLLKILARITEPTAGRARVRGRIGSLLEVGTGFHPELTGRENIYLNGAILGMKKREIAQRFDEIVAFAEVSRFIDTPLKRYSTGMHLRLAFAVAAHLEPEILLVDEVLAVGDAGFQRKCLGKMGEVCREGRTILFVSHNMTAVQQLCHRALWLKDGRIFEEGAAGTVVGHYLQQNAASQPEALWDDPRTAPGNDKVRLHRVRVLPRSVDESGRIAIETPLDIEFRYWNLVPGAELNVSFFLYNLEEVCVFNLASESAPRPAGLVRHICHIPGNLLNAGSYYIRMLIVRDTSAAIFSHPSVVSFDVDEGERVGAWFGKWPGAVRPAVDWECEMLPDAACEPAQPVGVWAR